MTELSSSGITPLHVVLYEPEIPPNTGNIIRLCANTGAALHLIRPFGFEWDDRRLRRAGLDYHALASVTLHDNLSAYRAAHGDRRLLALTTKATQNYSAMAYQPTDALLFGPETRGLPDFLLEELTSASTLRIPMVDGSRSLNVANAVAVVLYEAWRQLGFHAGQ